MKKLSQLDQCRDRIQQRARKRTVDHLADGRDYQLARDGSKDEASFKEWVEGTPHSYAQARKLMRLSAMFKEGLTLSGVPLATLELISRLEPREHKLAVRALMNKCVSAKVARNLLFDMGILTEEDLEKHVLRRDRYTIKRVLNLLSRKKEEGLIAKNEYVFANSLLNGILETIAEPVAA